MNIQPKLAQMSDDEIFTLRGHSFNDFKIELRKNIKKINRETALRLFKIFSKDEIDIFNDNNEIISILLKNKNIHTDEIFVRLKKKLYARCLSCQIDAKILRKLYVKAYKNPEYKNTIDELRYWVLRNLKN